MLKKWAEGKCLKAFMAVIGAKEGEWFEAGEKEYMILNGEVYYRKLTMDVVSSGLMVSNAEANSVLRGTFKPKIDAVYYYWIVDAETKEWKLQCTVCHDTDKDRQNSCMHNCFPNVLAAEVYKTEWKKIFQG